MAKLARLLLVLVLLAQILPPALPAAAQTDSTPESRAAVLLAKLTPEERVGQLFLVTFKGPAGAPGTPDSQQIYDLITQYHVGGVVLQLKNDNFVAYDRGIGTLQSLTEQLQRNEYAAALARQTIPGGTETFFPSFIPLFIGVAQNGDGYPYDQILTGLTQLPNQMTLGATWQPDLAQKAGQTLGRELNILGINLMLGPSLDVLEPPYPESGSDLGVRSFGGDPFWVGEMGRAYISGLHQGSNNRLVVVGKHFPGFGGSDRLPEDEVSTVRKTLEQLKQFELFPFFAVTGNAPSPEATLDALLTSHIRYQGFQENFRATTKPVSFDPNAFAQLMALPELSTWRDNGGVMISDSLGSRAVRRFYDPTGETFSGRTVATDAFLAGNDLLYLSDFISSGDTDAYTSITRTLTFFARKYREDTAFAQRVDTAVLRILSLKYRLYGTRFSLEATLPLVARNAELGRAGALNFEIAQQAATLINPPAAEIEAVIPQQRERIVFLTDTRQYQQCINCPLTERVPANALEQVVLRLYSTQADGQIAARDLKSYTFSDLQQMLDGERNQYPIEADLRQAQWLVFLTLEINPAVPSSLALRRLLEERPDLLQGKRSIAFAMNAPYFLDATEISRFTAYYGLYSRSSAFIEVAARLLFQELLPPGSLPVSVPGIGYDVNLKTFPDPNRQIPLQLDFPAQPTAEPGADTPTPIPPFIPQIGDLIPLRTGVLLDHNGNTVPDGTIVRFILTNSSDPTSTRQVEALTSQGIARAILRVDSPGEIEIRVESEPAFLSDALSFAIAQPGGSPTAQASFTPQPSETVTPTPSETPVPATPTPTLAVLEAPPRRVQFSDWLASLLVALGIGVGLAGYGMLTGNARLGLRGGLLALIGGGLAYTYLAMRLPGAAELLTRSDSGGVMLATATGALVGALAAWRWQQRTNAVK